MDAVSVVQITLTAFSMSGSVQPRSCPTNITAILAGQLQHLEK
jgi:hypothetical protein